MNILFLSQVLPYPLDAGPKVRAYHVLQQLGQHHGVTLATFVRASDPPQASRHLETVIKRLVTCPMQRSRRQTAAALARSLVHGEPVLIARDRVAAMMAALQGLVRDTTFEAIHADQLWMAPYALAAARATPPGRPRPRLVLDKHNAVYQIPRRLATSAGNPLSRAGWRREAGLMARFEKQTCMAFDHVVTVTDVDARALAALYAPGQAPSFRTIPICIDAGLIRMQTGASESDHLLFLGGMHWPPNAEGVRWFANEILPAIRSSRPQARLLAGRPAAAGRAAQRPEPGIH